MMGLYFKHIKVPILLKFPDLFNSYQEEEMAWRKESVIFTTQVLSYTD